MEAYLTAIAQCNKFDREDLVETVILPKVVEAATLYITDMAEKEEKLKRVVDRLLVLREKKLQQEEMDDDAQSVWSQSTNASMSGISGVSGMTSFLQEAGGKSSALLSVSPVEDMSALSRRAGNTEVHAERSVKVMQFGAGVPQAMKHQKKKQRIRPGSVQEEEALNKMAELIMNVSNLRSEASGMCVKHRRCLLVEQGALLGE